MYSDISKRILDSNYIKPEFEKEFIKELRLTLRVDYGISTKDVKKLSDNKVIETWYEISSIPGNIITGQSVVDKNRDIEMELNKIYQGDSLELLRQLPDNSVDLVITSPPYADLKIYIDNPGIPPNDYVNWFIPYCVEICRVIKPTGSFILNINDKVVNGFRHPYVFDLISELHKETDLKLFERLFWNKMKGLPNRSRFGDRVEYLFWFAKEKNFYFNIDEMRTEYSVKSINRMKKPLKKRYARSMDEKEEYKDWSPNPKGALPTTLVNISSESKRIADNHVAVYPVELVKYFIKGGSKEGDVVLDPFMGTGTTAIACLETGRSYIGFELQQDYIDVAHNRILNYMSH